MAEVIPSLLFEALQLFDYIKMSKEQVDSINTRILSVLGRNAGIGERQNMNIYLEEKVRRFSMAALGELLFYVSSQNERARDSNRPESPLKDNRPSSGWQGRREAGKHEANCRILFGSPCSFQFP
ncbi:hypothetical protein PTKIN_Ptkin09bG0029100 [Pterospermum kingtungense]